MLLFSKASYNIARLRLHAGLPRIPLACEILRGSTLNYALELKPNQMEAFQKVHLLRAYFFPHVFVF